MPGDKDRHLCRILCPHNYSVFTLLTLYWTACLHTELFCLDWVLAIQDSSNMSHPPILSSRHSPFVGPFLHILFEMHIVCHLFYDALAIAQMWTSAFMLHRQISPFVSHNWFVPFVRASTGAQKNWVLCHWLLLLKVLYIEPRYPQHITTLSCVALFCAVCDQLCVYHITVFNPPQLILSFAGRVNRAALYKLVPVQKHTNSDRN